MQGDKVCTQHSNTQTQLPLLHKLLSPTKHCPKSTVEVCLTSAESRAQADCFEHTEVVRPDRQLLIIAAVSLITCNDARCSVMPVYEETLEGDSRFNRNRILSKLRFDELLLIHVHEVPVRTRRCWGTTAAQRISTYS